jgi:hypothetical protein
MPRSIRRILLTAAAIACAFAVVRAASRPPVAFPDGYRKWTHVSSTFIGSDAPPAAMTEQGVHHIYANDLALEGMRTGNYPDGARLVYDLIATHTVNGVTKEAERKRLDVMEKNAAAFADTGGWSFESFVGGDRKAGRVGDKVATMCWSCHAQKTQQGVFSTLRE